MPSPLMRFSKPSHDVAPESGALSNDAGRKATEQISARRNLPQGNVRSCCLLCGASFSTAPSFKHLEVDYFSCPSCTHIQSREMVDAPPSFSGVYPPLEDRAHLDRCQRIYKPKLDWILESLATLGVERSRALNLGWLEIGCGTGGFVRALELDGAPQIRGFDRDEAVLTEARRHVKAPLALWGGSPQGVLPPLEADIVTGFFVFEHVENLARACTELKASRARWLALSVPCYGLGAALEGAAPGVFARNLDGVVHRQIFTEKSLSRFLALAGYESAAQWSFGQDALDLQRVLLASPALAATFTLHSDFTKALTPALDRLQSALDIAGLADSRHILARKIR